MPTTTVTTPIPPGVSPDAVISVLHNHHLMIAALAPENRQCKLVSGDPARGGAVVYHVTAPTPIGTSMTYPLTLTNVSDGVDTLVQPKPPVGKLEIAGKWRVGGGKLREDVEIEANFLMKKMVKGNVEKLHPGQHKVILLKAAA